MDADGIPMPDPCTDTSTPCQRPVNPNMPPQLVYDPREEIAKFLLDNDTIPKRRLDVSMEFARSMSEELQMVLSQWQALERELRQLKAAGDN